MKLVATTAGAATGRDITFLHGFTQTSTSWMPVITRLPEVRATLIDAPGHGMNTDTAGDLWSSADALAAAMPQGVVVGYSMGARMALHVALSHPEQIDGLVLVSGTPGIEDNDERAARRASDEALAARAEVIGTAEFVDEWLANPMFAGLSEEMAMRAERCRNTSAGLAASLRLAGTGTQDNLWPRLSEIQVPTLVIAGADDAKFAAIASRMGGLIPRCEVRIIAGAGHTVHLERTAQFCDVLAEWLVRTTR